MTRRVCLVATATMAVLAAFAGPALANSGPDMYWFFSPLPETYMVARSAALATLAKYGIVVAVVSGAAAVGLWLLARSADHVE
jgi:hypothetical protein